jgi:hypothetical protein
MKADSLCLNNMLEGIHVGDGRFSKLICFGCTYSNVCFRYRKVVCQYTIQLGYLLVVTDDPVFWTCH